MYSTGIGVSNMPYIDRAFIGGLSFLRTAILLMADGAPSAVNKLACYWFLLILAFRSMLAEMRYRERNRGHRWTHLHYLSINFILI